MTYRLDGKTLEEWHTFLTTDQETGEDTGHLACPCSRYGRNGDECAWFAIAAELVFVDVNGDVENSIDYLMGLAVNGHDDIAYLVYHNWYLFPRSLKRMLGTRHEIEEMMA